MSGSLSNIELRAISAIVLAVSVLFLTWLGGLPFRLLCAAMAAAMFYEWCSISHAGVFRTHQRIAFGLLFAVLLALVVNLPAVWLFGLLTVAIAVCAIDGKHRGAGSWTAVGLAYSALPAICLALLRDRDASGLAVVLFLLAVVWATDIVAFFVGKAVGGPKLAPAISPGKTQSGALGGAVGAVLAGIVVAALLGSRDLAILGGVALLLSVVAQCGDLFESWVKRRHGVKDSGNSIPGHGGVLDRVDGLVAAAVMLYILGSASTGLDSPARGLFAG